MKYILTLDQGTTGSRAIIYDKQGKIVTSAYQEYPQYFPRPGWVEHDPEEIWNTVNNSIQKVLKVVGGESIAAIGITNQRETTIIWDRKTGKPIYNAIVWQCRRTATRCEQLKKNTRLVEEINKKTGLKVDAYFSATKIEWILNMVVGARRRALRGELAFGTVDTWLLWKLTNGKVHATDYSNASRTMLFNIEKLEWDKELLRTFGVPKEMLPMVQNSSGEFGETVKIGLLPVGVKITGIAGDQQAGLFGQACFEPGEMNCTYGTGGFILLNTGKKRAVSKAGLLTTLGCDREGKPAYILEGGIFIAGAAIQWLRDGLQIIADAAQTEKMARAVADTGGVYFVSAFVGLGAPYWNANARGMIMGLTRGTTRNHIVRAALEGMCYQITDVFFAMQRDAQINVKSLRVNGGACKNNFVCQFQADMLQTTIVRPTVIETTSLGAAYLAGLAVGYWKNAAEIKKCWQKEREFRPRMDRNQREKLYSGWKVAVKRVVVE